MKFVTPKLVTRFSAIIASLVVSACQLIEPNPNASITGISSEKERHKPDTTLSGEQLFVTCAACHNITKGGDHKVGPNLYAVVGQSAASKPGFKYSDALSKSGLVWDEATLSGWILATERVVPGTWMTYHNHLSTQETLRLVDYIATVK